MKKASKALFTTSLILFVVGVACVVVGLVSGGDFRKLSPVFKSNEKLVSYDVTFDKEIKNLKLSNEVMSMKVVYGDSFKVSVKNVPEDSVDASVEGDTLVVDVGFDSGWNVLDNAFRWMDGLFLEDEQSMVTVTIPKDFVADKVEMNLDTGDIEVEEIKSKKGTFEVSVGELTLERCVIEEKADFTIRVGDINVEQFEVDNMDVEIHVGNFEGAGTVKSKAKLSTNVGSIGLDLDGKMQDYQFICDTDVGDIEINNDSYGDKTIGTDNGILIDCETNVGDITIDTK